MTYSQIASTAHNQVRRFVSSTGVLALAIAGLAATSGQALAEPSADSAPVVGASYSTEVRPYSASDIHAKVIEGTRVAPVAAQGSTQVVLAPSNADKAYQDTMTAMFGYQTLGAENSVAFRSVDPAAFAHSANLAFGYQTLGSEANPPVRATDFTFLAASFGGGF
jgi:hypothetical protein